MDQFVIDQIIIHLESNPTANPVEVVEKYRIAAYDQIEHAWECARVYRCEEGRVNNAREFLLKHFNVDL